MKCRHCPLTVATITDPSDPLAGAVIHSDGYFGCYGLGTVAEVETFGDVIRWYETMALAA